MLNEIDQPSRKRQRTGTNEDASPRKSSITDSATSSPLQAHPATAGGNSSHPRLKNQSSTPNSTQTWTPSTTFDPNNPSALTNPNGGSLSSFDFTNWDRGQPTTQPHFNPGIGSAVYATPQDLAFAQSTMNMNLPGQNASSAMGGDGSAGNNLQEYSDPMFWGNMDYNVADIFGSATWENMTGPFAPGGGVGGGWEM